MYFYVMDAQLCQEMSISTKYVDGEIDIYKLPVQEVEVRQKDLLPVLHGSHGIHPDSSDGRYSIYIIYLIKTSSPKKYPLINTVII